MSWPVLLRDSAPPREIFPRISSRWRIRLRLTAKPPRPSRTPRSPIKRMAFPATVSGLTARVRVSFSHADRLPALANPQQEFPNGHCYRSPHDFVMLPPVGVHERRRRQFELTRVRQDAALAKTANFQIQKQCLVPAPRKGRRPGHVLYAPGRGSLSVLGSTLFFFWGRP